MLATDKPLDRFRVEFRESLTLREIEALVSNPNLRILQCASPVQSHTWDLLNENLFPLRPDVEMRVYGFYSSTCDLTFARRLSNVRRFSADCLMRAVGVEHLSALVQLEELSIDIFNLESFDFLEAIPDGIKSLFLGATKSRKPSLDSLGRFRCLRKLCIEGQQNGIAVIGDLQELEDVTLRSISTSDIEYVARLPRLWSLDIKLGGIQSISAISGKESLKYLELWQIRGLSDISVVSSLSGLQYLFLQSLRNVTSVPDLSRLTKLRRLHLENMKGLRDVDAIQDAPALEEFIHVSAQNMRPEQYRGLLNMPRLREILVGFGSQRKNQEFENATIKCGKVKLTFGNTQFIFQ